MKKSAKMKLSEAIELSIPRVQESDWGNSGNCLVCQAVHFEKVGCTKCPVGFLGNKLYRPYLRLDGVGGCVPFGIRLDEASEGITKESREKAREQLRLLIARLRRQGK